MKCNVKNVRRAIEVMRSVPEENFEMNDWRRVNECGTAACFAGHLALSKDIPEIMFGSMAQSLVADIPVYRDSELEGAEAVAEFLGVSDADDICGLNCVYNPNSMGYNWYSDFYNKHLQEVTTKDVIKKLQNMIRN